MRTSIIFVALLLCSSSLVVSAGQSKLKSTLTSLVNLESRAVDAVDAALEVLRGLKDTNVQSQAKADDLNRTQEEELGRQIS